LQDLQDSRFVFAATTPVVTRRFPFSISSYRLNYSIMIRYATFLIPHWRDSVKTGRIVLDRMASEPTSTPEAPTLWRGRPRDSSAHQAILAATLELLDEVGYQRLTIEGVAKRARVGKSTIYRWWESKLDLLLEAAAPHLEIGLVPDTGNTRRDLAAGIRQAIDTYSDRVAADVIFVVIADLEEDPRLRDIFRKTWVLPWRTSMAQAIERGVSRGDLPRALDVQFVIDVLVGTIFQRVLIVPQPMTKGLAKRLVDLVMEGKLP